MSDELLKLKAALKEATPRPSEEARAAALARAMDNFDEVYQGSVEATRQTGYRAVEKRGILKGLFAMLQQFSSRQILVGTASLATLMVAVGVSRNLHIVYPDGDRFSFNDTISLQSDLDEATLVPPAAGVQPKKPNNEQITAVDEALVEEIQQNEPLKLRSETAQPKVGAKQQLAETRSDDIVGESPVSTATERKSLVPQITPQEHFSSAQRNAESDVLLDQTTAETTPEIAITLPQVRAVTVISNRQGERIAAEPIERLQDRERFPEAVTNPLRLTKEHPVSTFSIDVDTASYAYVRSSINGGRLPTENAVRVEELINYFDYAYAEPENPDTPFSTSVSVIETPWNSGTKLMQIGIKGYQPLASAEPPRNLVFLIDTSGSMNAQNKLPLLIQSFRLLLTSLNPHDQVAIVTYAGSAGLVLEPTAVSERTKILNSLERLRAGGSTAGQAGLQQAYQVAAEMMRDGDNDNPKARIILATDGDFNVGISDPKKLKGFVADKRKEGSYLSVVGFGRGNYHDALMQALAQNGNGFAAYIDTLSEAQKVFVDQVAGSLTTIADDVKIQVEFNPARISEYRLIGYETRALKREDFNNDKVDAGEIGAGHTVTAIYEITPVGSKFERVDPLRYQTNQSQDDQPMQDEKSDELAFVKLRYKAPGDDISQLIDTPVTEDRQDISASEAAFAAAVAGFGQLLRRNNALGSWSFRDAEELARAGLANDRFGYRREFISMVRLAESLK